MCLLSEIQGTTAKDLANMQIWGIPPEIPIEEIQYWAGNPYTPQQPHLQDPHVHET